MARGDIFLASAEAKDTHCLAALAPALSERFDAVHLFNPYADVVDAKCDALTAFAEAEFPVVVISSVTTVDMLNLVRPRDTYLCIGVEHGIAPFKSYTYDPGLLASDFYLAPTLGWAARLARLYPDRRAKIRLGGYPKIEAMRDHLRQAQQRTEPSGTEEAERILVLLSWGISADASELLPDRGFIDYVLHPADFQKLETLQFERARVHLSRPEITYPLIASASAILGDFSSLTLECIALGRRVSFLLDSSLYDVSCDVEDSFIQRDNAEFGKIPFTNDAINPNEALTASEFTALVQGTARDFLKRQAAMRRASIPSDYLPPSNLDNRQICVAEILDIVDRYAPVIANKNDVHESLGAVDSLCFLSDVYPALLSRPPDRSGLMRYLPLTGRPDDPQAAANAIAVVKELNRSAEASQHRTPALDEDSTQRIASILSKDLDGGSLRACRTLDALTEHILPSFHRRRRDAAGTDAERIRYGAKLAAARAAEVDDLIELAHACAREERLHEAFGWVAVAIETRPCDGELLRFQTSLLERLGEVENALAVAEQAKRHGADQTFIEWDITRLRERFSTQLREMIATSDLAGRLACRARLVSIGCAGADDMLRLACDLLAMLWRVRALPLRSLLGGIFGAVPGMSARSTRSAQPV